MVSFKTLSAKVFDPTIKATVQKTGKLGFGDGTRAALSLNEQTYVKIVIDEEAGTLYMCVLRAHDADAFQVRKSGSYYYLSTSRLFDSLNINYKSETVIYDFVRCTQYDIVLGGEVYRMDYRNPRRSKGKVVESIDNDDFKDEEDSL